MGMLLRRHRTYWAEVREQEKNAQETVKAEEIPFTEPEEPVEEPEKKTVRKSAPATRRRKSTK